MAIGRKPQPVAFSQASEAKNNKGELVSPRNNVPGAAGADVQIIDWSPPKPSPLFSLNEPAMFYYEHYMNSMPKGFFGRADALVLEKLCLLYAIHDKLMIDLAEEEIIEVEEQKLGALTITTKKPNPRLKVMVTLNDQIARYVILLGLTPRDRGRPMVDEKGAPLNWGKGGMSAAQLARADRAARFGWSGSGHADKQEE